MIEYMGMEIGEAMTMDLTVRLVSQSDRGLACCAAAARLSTTSHPAWQLMEQRQGDAQDQALVRKVLSSGHRSVLEHHAMTYALDGVSVLAEQFLIECRLCSFTVKSRRYVDFSQAGYYVPPLAPALETAYRQAMEARFADYAALTALGVPREDARFVLPYCFYSSLYLSANAREMALLIAHLCWGRGRNFPELRRLGQAMAQPYEGAFPGVLDTLRPQMEAYTPWPLAVHIAPCAPCTPRAQLLSAPPEGSRLLAQGLAFSQRFPGQTPSSPPGFREQDAAEAEPFPQALSALVQDPRPRELELLSYVFRLEDLSLAGLTHLARHRIQSPLFSPILTAVNRQRYLLPPSVSGNAPALALYQAAFEAQRKTALNLADQGLSPEDLSYMALSGLTVETITAMNARELLHFMKLRTCTRAQWEIRGLAGQLLEQLRALDPALFSLYGPSCHVMGWCPEGRLSCGRAPTQPPSSQSPSQIGQ